MFCMYYVPWWPALPRRPSVLRSPWHPRPSVRRCCSTSWRCWFATHKEQELPFSREASDRQQKNYVKESTNKTKQNKREAKRAGNKGKASVLEVKVGKKKDEFLATAGAG